MDNNYVNAATDMFNATLVAELQNELAYIKRKLEIESANCDFWNAIACKLAKERADGRV